MYVSPIPDGPIVIYPNNSPPAATVVETMERATIEKNTTEEDSNKDSDTTTATLPPPASNVTRPTKNDSANRNTANVPTEPVAVKENKIEEDLRIDTVANRFILSLGEEEERELIEAMTRSPHEITCDVDKWKFPAWNNIKLPRAIFEPPPNTNVSQKNPTVQRKTTKMSHQPKSVSPCKVHKPMESSKPAEDNSFLLLNQK